MTSRVSGVIDRWRHAWRHRSSRQLARTDDVLRAHGRRHAGRDAAGNGDVSAGYDRSPPAAAGACAPSSRWRHDEWRHAALGTTNSLVVYARTMQLRSYETKLEKRKTERLLHEMLPKSVAHRMTGLLRSHASRVQSNGSDLNCNMSLQFSLVYVSSIRFSSVSFISLANLPVLDHEEEMKIERMKSRQIMLQ